MEVFSLPFYVIVTGSYGDVMACLR